MNRSSNRRPSYSQLVDPSHDRCTTSELTFYHFRYALVDFGLAHKAPVAKDKSKPVVEKKTPLSPSKTVESQENQVNLMF